MACLHPISRLNGRILTKLVHLYCCDIEKNWLDFGDLDPIFKVTQGLRLLKNGLSAPYYEGMDGFWPNLHNYIVVTWKRIWLYFGDLDPIFKVPGGLKLLENGFSAHYLQNEWMDLTKLVQLYCWDRNKNWLDFGDLDPLDFGDLDHIFKVTLGLRFWKMAPINHIHTQNIHTQNYRYNLFQPISLSDRWGHTFSSENTVLLI